MYINSHLASRHIMILWSIWHKCHTLHLEVIWSPGQFSSTSKSLWRQHVHKQSVFRIKGKVNRLVLIHSYHDQYCHQPQTARNGFCVKFSHWLSVDIGQNKYRIVISVFKYWYLISLLTIWGCMHTNPAIPRNNGRMTFSIQPAKIVASYTKLIRSQRTDRSIT